MATANFYARLERIEKAQAEAPRSKPVSFRTPGVAGIGALREKRARRRHPITDHLLSIAFGLVLGVLLTVGFIGLSYENSLWGPGTPWHDIAQYPVMAGFALGPLLLFLSLWLASSRPGFALFSLSYVTGIVIPMFI